MQIQQEYAFRWQRILRITSAYNPSMRLINLSSFPAGNFFESATHDTFSFFILPAPSNRNLSNRNFSYFMKKSRKALGCKGQGIKYALSRTDFILKTYKIIMCVFDGGYGLADRIKPFRNYLFNPCLAISYVLEQEKSFRE